MLDNYWIIKLSLPEYQFKIEKRRTREEKAQFCQAVVLIGVKLRNTSLSSKNVPMPLHVVITCHLNL